MKTSKILLLSSLLMGGSVSAELLLHENFSYPAGDLSGAAGTGWAGAWYDTGNPAVSISNGLAFTDSFGNVLAVSGGAVNSSDGGTETNISARETGQRGGEMWISMLLQPQTDEVPFFGLSFYQTNIDLANARFAIETAANKNLRLTRRAGGLLHTGSFSTTVGSPVLVVLRLMPDAGVAEGFPDRIEVFFNPRLSVLPTFPNASVDINGLQFDRIRIAGQTGRSVIVDEIRMGTTFADVVPHTPALDPDTDGDGLTDAQEIILGTDPLFEDAALFAAIRANPGWFDLHSEQEIVDVGIGGQSLEKVSATQLGYHLDIKHGNGTVIESVSRSISIQGAGKFIRVALNKP